MEPSPTKYVPVVVDVRSFGGSERIYMMATFSHFPQVRDIPYPITVPGRTFLFFSLLFSISFRRLMPVHIPIRAPLDIFQDLPTSSRTGGEAEMTEPHFRTRHFQDSPVPIVVSVNFTFRLSEHGFLDTTLRSPNFPVVL